MAISKGFIWNSDTFRHLNTKNSKLLIYAYKFLKTGNVATYGVFFVS